MQTTSRAKQTVDFQSIGSGAVVSPCVGQFLKTRMALVNDLHGKDNRTNWFSSHTPLPPVIKTPFQKLFLGSEGDVVIIPAQHNPNVHTTSAKENPNEVFTYKTLEAAKSFAKAFEQAQGPLADINHLINVNGAGNLITFGSPTSNLIVRTAMGYSYLGDAIDKIRGFELGPSDAFKLPYSYELDGYKILNSGLPNSSCIRETNGEKKPIPNWGILTPDGSPLFPQMDDKGALTQDYLLISSLPNMFNRASLDANHRVINFGGTHGEGTQAVSQLFTNEHMLQDLSTKLAEAEKKQSSPYWQALLFVKCESGGDVSLSHIEDFKTFDVDKPILEKLVSQNYEIIKNHK